MRAKVYITLKEEVLDPQGSAIIGSLKSLGFSGVRDARVGKLIELDLETEVQDEAMAQVSEMCDKLLANAVIEDYRVDFV
jgi:phosphoribosylformylglycinamidine synthase subunit PurS